MYCPLLRRAFVDPDNLQVRYLCVNVMEHGIWRNTFLTAVNELINDMPKRRTSSGKLKTSMMPEMMLDYLVMLIQQR